MGTWLSATPRGQFGAQAGGTIFTSSSRHRLGCDGFRERDHPVPGTQLPPGHFGDPHKEGFSCVSQPPSWESVSPSCPLHSPTQSQQALPLKSNWPLTSTSTAPVLIWSTFNSPEKHTSLLPGVSMFIWVPATKLKPNAASTVTPSDLASGSLPPLAPPPLPSGTPPSHLSLSEPRLSPPQGLCTVHVGDPAAHTSLTGSLTWQSSASTPPPESL